MDEAFSALDPLIRRDMQDELLEMQKTLNKTIIFITHDLNEALRLGNRIAIMKDGEIVQVGTGQEILENPANDYVRRFVEDIDRTKVYQAKDIMNISSDHGHLEMHPAEALRMMNDNNWDNLIVVDASGQAIGYLDYQEADRVLNQYHENIREAELEEVVEISPETPVEEIFDAIKEQKAPVVVSHDQKIQGVVVKGDLIKAMTDDNEGNIETDDIVNHKEAVAHD